MAVLLQVWACVAFSSMPLPFSKPFMRQTLHRRAQNEDQDEKIRSLGFSDRELQQSRSEGTPEPPRVNVQEVEVDPVTLTAIGFGLIAFNFLVLGNLGDGGIAGLVATIINTLKQ